VVVPPDVALDVDARVAMGRLELMGRVWDGPGLHERLVEAGSVGAGRLELDARVGLGSLEVRRAPA